MGETAVDYCVGRPVDGEQLVEAEASVWPVFVLWADGGVFCVQTGAVDGGRWTVQGPIDVMPDEETDYSQVNIPFSCQIYIQPNIFDKYTSTVFLPVVKMTTSQCYIPKTPFIEDIIIALAALMLII